MIFKKLNQAIPILNDADWFLHAPPKRGKLHWAPGRSAMETALLWLKGLPVPFAQIISPFSLSSFKVAPEFVTYFDNYRGEGRNHDLFIHAKDFAGDITAISIESKVDEEFGKTVADLWAEVQKRMDKGKNSNGHKRINELFQKLLPGKSPSQLPDLRYQLLTGIAGALAEAENQKAVRAVFIVQTLLTSSLDPKKHKSNQLDLDNFIREFTNGQFASIQNGQLIGPFIITWKKPMELWIGKYEV